MPKASLLLSCWARRFALAGAVLVLMGFSRLPEARAEFASPPESPYRPQDPSRAEPPLVEGDPRVEPWEPPPAPRASTFRFHVGPAVLLQPAGPGLFTALDIGPRAVGVRVSGAWLRAESEQGLAAYSAELWIDLRHHYELHPILGAGASFLHGGALGQKPSAGAGVLRGSLEYELPITEADARLGLDLIAWVPAIGTERTQPWVLTTLTVGASF